MGPSPAAGGNIPPARRDCSAQVSVSTGRMASDLGPTKRRRSAPHTHARTRMAGAVARGLGSAAGIKVGTRHPPRMDPIWL
eukprot:4787126-Pyramimonas_sp.AAC.2